MLPRFFSCSPLGIFLGGRSWCFSAEKTLKFMILVRKSLRDLFFFLEITCIFRPEKAFGFRRRHLFFWRSPVFGRKMCDFGQKKPSDFGEDLFFFWRSPVFGGKCVISARKSLRISVKTFFFWDHLYLGGKCVISARKSLRISAKTFAPLI